jgi:hypothetical protein
MEKDYSRFDKKTLFMHRTYLQDDGKWHEYFFGPLDASKSVVTALTEVTPSSFRSVTFDDWLVDLFEQNTMKKEFEIGSKKFVPDYTVHHTVDLRTKKA